MAQVASNSDPKISKGGGGGAKKQTQGKPARAEIDKRIKELKEVVGTIYDDDSLERVLEKNDYDTNISAEYILTGKFIHTMFILHCVLLRNLCILQEILYHKHLKAMIGTK